MNLVYLPFGKGGGKVGKVRISNLPEDNYSDKQAQTESCVENQAQSEVNEPLNDMEIETSCDTKFTRSKSSMEDSIISSDRVLIIDGMAVVNQIDFKHLQTCNDFAVAFVNRLEYMVSDLMKI